MNHSRKLRQLPFIWLFCLCVPAAMASADPAADKAKEKLSMQLMYHELDMKNQKAKQEVKVSLEIADLESAYEACIGKIASLETCREVTSSSADKLHARTQDARLLAESKKQTELLKRQEEATKQNNTSVTVIEDSPYHWRRPNGRPDWHRPDEPTPAPPRYTPKPGFVPQNRFQAGDGF